MAERRRHRKRTQVPSPAGLTASAAPLGEPSVERAAEPRAPRPSPRPPHGAREGEGEVVGGGKGKGKGGGGAPRRDLRGVWGGNFLAKRRGAALRGSVGPGGSGWRCGGGLGVPPPSRSCQKLGYVSAAGVLMRLCAQLQHQELGAGVCLLLAPTLRSGQVLWPCSEWR